jgi:hypothetical protein
MNEAKPIDVQGTLPSTVEAHLMNSSQIRLEDLPFLQCLWLPQACSLCWQSEQASIEGLSDLEILNLYERNWRYKGA